MYSSPGALTHSHLDMIYEEDVILDEGWVQSSLRLRSNFKFLKQTTKKKDINSLLFYQFYTEDLASIVLSCRKCNRNYRHFEQIHHLISLFVTAAAVMFLANGTK